MNTVDYSRVVGVFRERSNADQAIAKLKQAGFEGQIQLTEYNLPTDNLPTITPELSSSSLQEPGTRILVSVEAAGREQEAVDILVHNGANNADIPPGTQLVQGTLVTTDAEPVDLMPKQPISEPADLISKHPTSEPANIMPGQPTSEPIAHIPGRPTDM